MKKHEIIIGIDPDTIKSGIAVLETGTRKMEISTLEFPELIERLRLLNNTCHIQDKTILVVVEAGWLNAKSNFHGQTGFKGQRVAKNVGANHQTGKHIVEMCEFYGIHTELQKPLNKCWSGTNGKITHEELAYFTGITGKTSQDGRDAALIAWNYAGFPIKVKAK